MLSCVFKITLIQTSNATQKLKFKNFYNCDMHMVYYKNKLVLPTCHKKGTQEVLKITWI